MKFILFRRHRPSRLKKRCSGLWFMKSETPSVLETAGGFETVTSYFRRHLLYQYFSALTQD